MLRRARSVPVLLSAALLLAGCTGGSANSDTPSAPRLESLDTGPDGLIAAVDRQPAPSLSGTTLAGEALDVASFKGEVVVLNFWASWCGPCRLEAPTLNEVAARTADKGVQFVGINIKDEKESAQAFERNQQTPYPSIHDQPGRLLLRFRRIVPQTPPTTLVLDRQGRIAAFYAGAVRLSDLLDPVEQIAAET